MAFGVVRSDRGRIQLRSFVVEPASAAEPTRLARDSAAGLHQAYTDRTKLRNRDLRDALLKDRLSDLLLVVHNLVVRLDHVVGLGALGAAGRATRGWLLSGAVGGGASP